MHITFAILAAFAIFALSTKIGASVTSKMQKDEEEAFWERERKANHVRRKPIDHLDYIKIPDNLPYETQNVSSEAAACVKQIRELSSEKILNLTGYTNTDLKLEYGTANITELTKFDNHYTTLVTTLQKWADALLENGLDLQAVSVMEYAVSIRCDIGKTYRLLAVRYLKENQISKYEELIQTAQSLRSINKNAIVRSLQELHQCNDSPHCTSSSQFHTDNPDDID